MVEIYGYDYSGSSLAIMDPGSGSKVIVSYSYFISNATYCWNESDY